MSEVAGEEVNLPVEVLDLDGVREIMSWAEQEGWDPGLTDAVPFHAADNHGFFRSVDGDRTVATLSVVRATPEIAFLGLYIVDPELRKRKYGLSLWQEVLAGYEGFTIGLDAVPEQIDTYASSGFVSTYGNARYAGTDLPLPESSVAVVAAKEVAFQSLVEFDSEHYFGPRPGFLREWITGEGREALVTLEGDQITGFAASRRGSSSTRIGPVFAQDQETASELILNLAAKSDAKVMVDVPLPNEPAVAMLEGFGMERGFETRRMYRGSAPSLPLDRIFGVTSLELG